MSTAMKTKLTPRSTLDFVVEVFAWSLATLT